MKILVTGAEGFIGSHLTELLVEKGYSVKAFVRYNFTNNWGWLESSKYLKDIEIYTGDVRDYDSVYDSMKDVDVVFHLATHRYSIFLHITACIYKDQYGRYIQHIGSW